MRGPEPRRTTKSDVPPRRVLLTAAWLLLLVMCGHLGAESFRQQIENDWRRQDGCWLAEIREPGLVRFVEGEVPWPGVKPDDRLRVPKSAGPKLDGRLDDPCWNTALRLEGDGPSVPSLALVHDRDRLRLGVSLPTHSEIGFQGSSTALDAAGAVDGVKNGRYAFHTGHEPNPWWQVDLGTRRQIGRLVVYNRLDYKPGLHNADNLLVLTSDDGKNWTLVYDNQGKHFGGATSGEPLDVDFSAEPIAARFVRLQVRSAAPIFFHLDEVEIYSAAEPARNLALHRPARQSSLSIWSRGGKQAGALVTLAGVKVLLDKDDPNGVLVGGSPVPAERIGVLRENGRTTIELALPVGGFQGGFPREIVAPDGRTLALAPGSDWRIALEETPRLGFGRNRLTVGFEADRALETPVRLTVESVVFAAMGPERRTVLQRELSASEDVPVDFPIDHEGAAAAIVTARQGASEVREGRVFFIAPVRETLDRAARLLKDFGRPAPEGLADLRRRAAELDERERSDGPDPEARRGLYFEARWLAREVAMSNPGLDFEELLFVKRFTQETYPDVCLNHMPWVSRPGGDLCLLRTKKGDAALFPEVRTLINGRLGPGHVHGIDLSWDADRIVFGYAQARSDQPPEGWLDRRTNFELRRNEEPIHIFEIGVDGRGLRQLTDGQWSDLDPTYAPNGDIAFISERCGCSLQCNEYNKDETSCNLYVMRPDGSGIRHMSVSKDGDYIPHTFTDGTIGYTRWEYQERGWAHIQSVWFIRPDGTGADALYKQHMNNPWALEDMRSIPGSKKLAAVAAGHHTLQAGPVVVVDPHQGMNHPAGIRIVTPGVVPPEGGMAGAPVPTGGVLGRGGYYMNPWPLSEKHFLVSYAYCNGATGGPATEADPTGYALYLIDVYGTKELIYRDPAISCFVPIPLRARPRPPVYPDLVDPDLVDPEVPYATCMVANAGHGCDGLDPQRIRYLRIAHRLQWPYDNTHGGQRYEPDVKSVMINWTPARVIGEVPVEPDGSAHFRVPADTPVYFQLLDENHMELRRMRAFISFQPGEVRACHGCHESREEAPRNRNAPFPLALARDPSIPQPPAWGQKPISFLRDVQPILDRHCARCHAGLEPAGGLDFSGGLTAAYNRAYETIRDHGLVAWSNVGDDARVTPPLAFGSHKSKLVDVLRDGACSRRAALTDADWHALVTWIDANAPYHDAFINKRPTEPPYDLPADAELAAAIGAVHARRCSKCHEPGAVSRLDLIDLSDPAATAFLTAPLGEGPDESRRCAKAVYRDRSDPDFERVARLVEEAARKAWETPRRDLAALKDKRRLATRLEPPGPSKQ